MKHLKKFNESLEGESNLIESEIRDILQDDFLDAGHDVKIKFLEANVRLYEITSRQKIRIIIGNDKSYDRTDSQWIPLGDKNDSIRMLMNWAKSEGLNLIDFSVYDLRKIPHRIHGKEIYNNKIDLVGKNWDFSTWESEAGFIQITFDNLGWQTKYQGTYGTVVTDQIIQQYNFNDPNSSSKFLEGAAKIFNKLNHHPQSLHWINQFVFISLTTHSERGVTDKDWQVATELDKLNLSI